MSHRQRQPWHQRFAPIRWAREPLRRAFFHALRTALSTDDGKAIAAGTLDGLLRDARFRGVDVRQSRPAEYPELGRAAAAASAPTSRGPIIVTGRFRSGSTLLWNVFRNVDGCTAYYEPFNERRWFDPAARGDRTDPTHRQVSDYWREYEGLEHLADDYRAEWAERRLHMDESAWDPAMQGYIQQLIDAAPGRPVLQFNRVDFRLPWLRRNFPSATVVHLYRHPRDQWCSSLVDPRAFPSTASMSHFAAHDHFYLRAWARDLRYVYPFLDERQASHPYQLFYYIWRLSYACGVAQADHSLAFEQLVEHPLPELKRLMTAVGIHDYDPRRLSACIVRPDIGKWREYASNDWFEQIESACETVLATMSVDQPSRSRDTALLTAS